MQSQVNPNVSVTGLQIQCNSDEVESSCDIERPSTCTLKILKRQEKNQQEILHTLESLEKNSYKIYKLKKNFEIKRKKAELQNELLKTKSLKKTINVKYLCIYLYF